MQTNPTILANKSTPATIRNRLVHMLDGPDLPIIPIKDGLLVVLRIVQIVRRNSIVLLVHHHGSIILLTMVLLLPQRDDENP